MTEIEAERERLGWEALCVYRLMAPTEHLLATARAAGAAEEREGAEEEEETPGFGSAAQACLLRCVDDPVCVQFPPKAEYTQRVLKRAVAVAEAAGCEVRGAARCRGFDTVQARL
jgi:hypothetical protein